jgi:hypothetical protein
MSHLTTAFVIGAGGFIGRHLVHQWCIASPTPLGYWLPGVCPTFVVRALAPTLEIVGHLLRQLQRPLITRQAYRLTGGPNVFSTEKSRCLLGYAPVIPFEAAMKELEAHFSTRKGQQILQA